MVTSTRQEKEEAKTMKCPKCGSRWIADSTITMVIRKFGDAEPKSQLRFHCINCGKKWNEKK